MNKNKIYTLLQTYKLYNKIHFVHAKQSLGAISKTHTKQFSEHTDSYEYRSREAVRHSLKHEFLIDNWHLMNRMPNKIIRLFYRFFTYAVQAAALCGSTSVVVSQNRNNWNAGEPSGNLPVWGTGRVSVRVRGYHSRTN